MTIPVPPLEEQERIVAILDKFDALVNDLSVGLPAELAARRKQYEYYRDRLLTFEEGRHERGAGGDSLRPDLPSAPRARSSPSSSLTASRETAYQSEAELERGVHRAPSSSGLRVPAAHERGRAHREPAHAARGAERRSTFTDAEWERFFTEQIAGANDGIVEKTVRIQEDHVQLLKRDDGSTKNVC